MSSDTAEADPQAGNAANLAALCDALDQVRIARPAAVQVLTVVDDPNTDSPKVAATVELDPALTAQIMRLANSAFYGMSGRVGNTGFAVTVIGFSAVRSLAAMNATGLDDANQPTPAGFWRHAAASAAGCAAVAGRFGIPRNDAFAAGLLHDLGTALLHRFDPGAHAALLAEHGHDGRALRDAEAEVFGLGHDQAAARVLGAWRFPEAFVNAVGRHHESSANASPFDRVLMAGDLLAQLATGEQVLGEADTIALQLAGIEESELPELLAITAERCDEILATLPS